MLAYIIRKVVCYFMVQELKILSEKNSLDRHWMYLLLNVDLLMIVLPFKRTLFKTDLKIPVKVEYKSQLFPHISPFKTFSLRSQKRLE